MAKSLNLCQFIGNMGKDPEVKYLPDGKAVSNFSIACADDYKDAQGKKVEKTNWIPCVAFGRVGEIVGEYCRKGSKVYVSGKQVTRSWQDQAGQTRYATEIVVSELQMLDSKPEGAQAPAQDYRGHTGSNQANPTSAPTQPPAGFDNFDDDIPF